MNRKKFAPIVILIIVVVLVIIGGTWWYITSQNFSSNQSGVSVASSVFSSTTSMVATSSNMSTWPTYSNTRYQFQIQYPQDWKVNDQQLQNATSNTSGPGVLFSKIIIAQGTSGGMAMLTLYPDQTSSSIPVNLQGRKGTLQTLILGNWQGTEKIVTKDNGDPSLVQAILQSTIGNRNFTIYWVYSNQGHDLDSDNLIQEILPTLQLLK